MTSCTTPPSRPHDDLALRAQHDFEHEPQRLREPRARPLQSSARRAARRPRSVRVQRGDGRAARTSPAERATSATAMPDGRAATPCPGASRPGRGRGGRPGREADERPEEETRGDAEDDAGGGEERRGRSASPNGRRSTGAAVWRGGPSSTSPTTLTKQKTASAAVAARPASASAPANPPPTPPYAGTCSSACRVSHSEAKPFSGRQSRDRHRADEERAAGPRHTPQQAAEPIELERADRLLERTGAQEEKRLEDRVVDRVQQSRRQARTPPTRRPPAPAASGTLRSRAR